MSDYCTDPDCPAPSHQRPASAYRHGCRSEVARRAARRVEKARRTGTHVPRWVDPLPTRRRLEALTAIGWSSKDLAARLGITSNAVNLYRYEARINRASAEKVAALYAELHMIPGPSRIARTQAARKGWAPPLAWNDIDDPDEAPQLDAPAVDEPDENVVRAFIAGREPRWAKLAPIDREFLVRELKRRGYTRNAVALGTHASHHSVRHYWNKVGS